MTELRYSAGRLIGYVMLGVALAALFGWLAQGGVDPDDAGRGAFWLHLLGPKGVLAVFGAGAIASLALAVLYGRLLLRGPGAAAVADAGGIALHGAIRRHRLAWGEVSRMRLTPIEVGRRTHYLLQIDRRGGGKPAQLSLASVAGGVAAAERWLAEAERLRG